MTKTTADLVLSKIVDITSMNSKKNTTVDTVKLRH